LVVSPFDEYRRLMTEACQAVAGAKEASDRGDVAEDQRLLTKSVQLRNQAMAIMQDRK
jgi:hypothetical protein